MIVFKFPDARGSGSPPMQMRAADPVLASGNGRVPCARKQSPRLAVAASCHFEVTPIFPALVCWRWSHAPARPAISSSPAARVSKVGSAQAARQGLALSLLELRVKF